MQGKITAIKNQNWDLSSAASIFKVPSAQTSLGGDRLSHEQKEKEKEGRETSKGTLTAGDLGKKMKRIEMEAHQKKKSFLFFCGEVETVIKMKASKLVLFIHHTLVNEKFIGWFELNMLSCLV